MNEGFGKDFYKEKAIQSKGPGHSWTRRTLKIESPFPRLLPENQLLLRFLVGEVLAERRFVGAVGELLRAEDFRGRSFHGKANPSRDVPN